MPSINDCIVCAFEKENSWGNARGDNAVKENITYNPEYTKIRHFPDHLFLYRFLNSI